MVLKSNMFKKLPMQTGQNDRELLPFQQPNVSKCVRYLKSLRKMSIRGSERRLDDDNVDMNQQRAVSAVSLPAIDRESTIVHYSTMDVNLYSTKKTVAQGMLDIALLSANASQLKFVFNQGSEKPFYYATLSVIIISILLQIITGCFLIITGRYNINKPSHQKKAEKFNNASVVCIFIITVLNVFIAAFTAQDSKQPVK